MNAAQPRIRSRHEDRGSGSLPTVEQLIRDTHRVIENCHLRTSPSKVTRLCRDYVNYVAGKGISFGVYLGNAVTLTAEQQRRFDAAYYSLTYADPTGETAVRHVMAGVAS